MKYIPWNGNTKYVTVRRPHVVVAVFVRQTNACWKNPRKICNASVKTLRTITSARQKLDEEAGHFHLLPHKNWLKKTKTKWGKPEQTNVCQTPTWVEKFYATSCLRTYRGGWSVVANTTNSRICDLYLQGVKTRHATTALACVPQYGFHTRSPKVARETTANQMRCTHENISSTRAYRPRSPRSMNQPGANPRPP